MSKGRAWAIVTIITVALIVALGVGLGLGLRKKDDDNTEEVSSTTQIPTTTHSPLYSPPSASIEGRYRFAAVAADSGECSKIGK